MNNNTLSVSEVSNYIKKVIDSDFILSNLSVKGEISNLKYHSSGHIYFSLKDNMSKINCVMFKNKAILLNMVLKEGLEVIVTGRASIYTGSGSLQIYCDDISKEGEGELYLKFEKLKKKLEDLGYFDEQNKKVVPLYPKRIGIVTSETGSVIKDIINVTTRRNKMVDLVLYSAKVQGIGAYKEIINGIEYFNEKSNVDVIIIGRGGGSIEELWNFNEEALAKSIYSSHLPIISAVGHETDFTISDFVADMRAATPSQGAEIAVPLESDMIKNIDLILSELHNNISGKIEQCKNDIKSMEKMLRLNSPLSKIQNCYIQCDGLKERLDISLNNKIVKEKQRLENLNDLLIAHNPVNVLKRGYAIIEDEKNNVIRSIKDLDSEKKIKIICNDGSTCGNFIKEK